MLLHSYYPWLVAIFCFSMFACFLLQLSVQLPTLSHGCHKAEVHSFPHSQDTHPSWWSTNNWAWHWQAQRLLQTVLDMLLGLGFGRLVQCYIPKWSNAQNRLSNLSRLTQDLASQILQLKLEDMVDINIETVVSPSDFSGILGYQSRPSPGIKV